MCRAVIGAGGIGIGPTKGSTDTPFLVGRPRDTTGHAVSWVAADARFDHSMI